MSDELFSIPPTPLPPLEAARLRLAEAVEFLIKVREGTDRSGISIEEAQDDVDWRTQEVTRLEREALSCRTDANPSTGTRTTGAGGH